MRLNIKYILFLVLVAFSSGGCTKLGKNLRAKGHVYDAQTGQPVGGVTFILENHTGPLWWAARKREKSDESNAEGEYDVSAYFLSKSYYLSATPPIDYVSLGWLIDGTLTESPSLRKGKTLKADYYVARKGKMHITVTNVNCSGSTDRLVVYRQYVSAAGTTPESFEYFGCSPFQYGAFDCAAGFWSISWTVYRNGTTQSGSQSVTVQPGAEQTVHINY